MFELDTGGLLVKPSLRTCVTLMTLLFFITILGLQSPIVSVQAQQPIIITDVVVPDQVPQANRGQVSAKVYNTVNTTFDGYAQFTDLRGEITSNMINFSIGYQETLDIVVQYQIDENATIGFHDVTFNIFVGGFSHLYYQYALEVVPVAVVSEVIPGQVFIQGQTGTVLATIENRAPITISVIIELYGPKFINASYEIDLAPGMNTVAIAVQHNASHVFDFGMSEVTLALHYQEVRVASSTTLVPVDMMPLNKALAIILPVLIFQVLVLLYAYRKRQRIRALTED